MRVQFFNKLMFSFIAIVFCPANLIGSVKPSEIDPTSNDGSYAEIKQQNSPSTDAIKPKYAPGSIYLWNGKNETDEPWKKWEPLVEAKYEITPITNRKSIIENVERLVKILKTIAPKQRPILELIYLKLPENEYSVVKWIPTKYCDKLNRENVYVISHGMNNWHDEKWISDIAEKLYAYDPESSIICVDWGYWAKGAYINLEGHISSMIDPTISSMKIDDAVDNIHDALITAFGGNVDLSKFYMIGHSHGAHLNGRLTVRFNQKAKRLTALDASEEISHLFNDYKVYTWQAEYIDYYKSSIIFGTEHLPGDDNFILIKEDGDFSKSIIIKATDELKNAKNHGYACEWFASTIDKNCKVGFNWGEERKKHPKVTKHSGWSGVINGPRQVIECYSKYTSRSTWHYPEPWYINETFNKPSEWDFCDAIASTFDYEPKTINLKNTNIRSIPCNTSVAVETKLNNHADNLSVPLTDIAAEATIKISKSLMEAEIAIFGNELTKHIDEYPSMTIAARKNDSQKKCTNVLYVTKASGSSDPVTRTESDSISYIDSDTELYYLTDNNEYILTDLETGDQGEYKDFMFTIPTNLWEKLGGDPKQEFLKCKLILIAGVDKSSNYQSTTRSVKLWKGELDPTNNVKVDTFLIETPKLICDAGPDKSYTLKKGKYSISVKVNGKVIKGDNNPLTYEWKYEYLIFGKKQSAKIDLEIGQYPLVFKINDGSIEATDTVMITVNPYKPTDSNTPNIPNISLPNPLMSGFVISLGYGGESFTAQNHYHLTSSKGISTYLGRINYIIPMLANTASFGIDYGIDLRYSFYNNEVISKQINPPGEAVEGWYNKLKGSGRIGAGVGPAFSLRLGSNAILTAYAHATPSLLFLNTMDTVDLTNLADDEHCGYVGWSMGEDVGLRCVFRNVGFGFEWNHLSGSDINIFEPYFDDTHDGNTGNRKMNTKVNAWRINVVFNF